MLMNESLILGKFENLRVWANGDQRAVHKPLLILYALAQLQAGHAELLYETVDEPLKELLKNFGPNSKAYHTQYPFWRLQSDGIWELTNEDKVGISRSGDPKKTDLIKYFVEGGFKPEIIKLFKSKPRLLDKVAKDLLSAHFPETWHEEIIDAIGLQFSQDQYDSVKEKRDPKFRNRILIAYQYNCAVCSSSIQIGDYWPTLEAAHIKWHQANGPDIESNGLALCSTHHKLFDRGSFTLDSRNQLIASEEVHGNGLDEIILKYHGRVINRPIRNSYIPDSEFTSWHRKEVFRGKGREI